MSLKFTLRTSGNALINTWSNLSCMIQTFYIKGFFQLKNKIYFSLQTLLVGGLCIKLPYDIKSRTALGRNFAFTNHFQAKYDSNKMLTHCNVWTLLNSLRHVGSLFVFVLKCLMCDLQNKLNAKIDLFIVVVFVTYLLFGNIVVLHY